MRATAERVEALRAILADYIPRSKQWRFLKDMLIEAEQELPKPLVLRTHSTERNYFAAYFTRDLEPEDIVAIRAALKKAFPAKEQP